MENKNLPYYRALRNENFHSSYGHRPDHRSFMENDRPGMYHEGRWNNPYENRFHRGKGPRNYKRSDNRILEDINDRLGEDPYIDAREVNCEVYNGDVILSGTVGNRWDKRRAADIAENVVGVINVENRIRINVGDSHESYQPDSEFQGNDKTQLESFKREIRR